MEKKSTAKYITLAVFFCFICSGSAVFAADLSFSPLSGSHSVGQTFPVVIILKSPDQSSNAVSGTVRFEKDKLKVVSISNAGSILSLWVQNPSFSNESGTLNFEGIILNPGYQGSSGKILTVNFKAIAEGNAHLSYSSGSVLANDGEGTNILNNLGSADFSIGRAAFVPDIASVVKKEAENVQEKVTAAIEEPTFYNITSLVITVIILLIIIVALILFFGLLVLFGWKKINKMMIDIRRLRHQNLMEERALSDLRAQVRSNKVETRQDLEHLKDIEISEEQKLARLKEKVDNQANAFGTDVQQLREANIIEEQGMGRLENKVFDLEKDVKQIKDSSIEKDLSEMEEKLNEKTQKPPVAPVKKENLPTNIFPPNFFRP